MQQRLYSSYCTRGERRNSVVKEEFRRGGCLCAGWSAHAPVLLIGHVLFSVIRPSESASWHPHQLGSSSPAETGRQECRRLLMCMFRNVAPPCSLRKMFPGLSNWQEAGERLTRPFEEAGRERLYHNCFPNVNAWSEGGVRDQASGRL